MAAAVVAAALMTSANTQHTRCVGGGEAVGSACYWLGSAVVLNLFCVGCFGVERAPAAPNRGWHAQGTACIAASSRALQHVGAGSNDGNSSGAAASMTSANTQHTRWVGAARVACPLFAVLVLLGLLCFVSYLGQLTRKGEHKGGVVPGIVSIASSSTELQRISRGGAVAAAATAAAVAGAPANHGACRCSRVLWGPSCHA